MHRCLKTLFSGLLLTAVLFCGCSGASSGDASDTTGSSGSPSEQTSGSVSSETDNIAGTVSDGSVSAKDSGIMHQKFSRPLPTVL